jgi:hypothetical protein
MRQDGPAPSISSLVSSWLSLTGWVFAACAERANTFVEGGNDRVSDAILDVDSEPREPAAAGASLPPLDADAFVADMRERVEQILRQAAEVVNQEPNACLTAVTRDRLQTLFRALADEALTQALEARIAAAEGERGEAGSAEWVRRYRRILASEGRWPPVADEPPVTSEA